MTLEASCKDEARSGQHGSLTRIWAERGSRPTAPRDQRYQSAYLFGAVCPARGVGAGLVLPRANVHASNLHLQEISRQISYGAFAVLTLDGAGWHQAGDRLVVPDNIALLHLPPYSPELNPVETVWEFLRQNHLSNRVYATYKAIVDACCSAWNKLIAAPKQIRSIARRDHTKTAGSCVVRYQLQRNQRRRAMPDTSPLLGIFWAVTDPHGQTHLLAHPCALADGEPYGDCITSPAAHYETWEAWRRGRPKPPLALLAPIIVHDQYEHWPRGRIVYEPTPG